MSGRYKEEMIYQTFEALKPLEKLMAEAHKAVTGKDRVTTDDQELLKVLNALDVDAFKKVAGGAAGAVVGGGLGYAALFFAGIKGFAAPGIAAGLAAIGGGMLAGMAVLAVPVVILGIGGFALMGRTDKKKLQAEKDMIRREAFILKDQLQKLVDETPTGERHSYLTKMLILIESAIADLDHDLRFIIV